MKRVLITIGISSLLGACATPNLDRSYTLSPQSKEGVVTGTITYSGRYSGYSVHFRQLPSGASGKFEAGAAIALLPFPSKDDHLKDGRPGAVFAANLMPGEYEVYRWSIGSGYAHVYSTNPFSIRFKIEPGTVVYLGNFHFTQTSGIGLTVTGATLSYHDRAAKDVPLFQENFPSLANAPLNYSVDSGMDQQNLGGQSTTRITMPVFIPVGK